MTTDHRTLSRLWDALGTRSGRLKKRRIINDCRAWDDGTAQRRGAGGSAPIFTFRLFIRNRLPSNSREINNARLLPSNSLCSFFIFNEFVAEFLSLFAQPSETATAESLFIDQAINVDILLFVFEQMVNQGCQFMRGGRVGCRGSHARPHPPMIGSQPGVRSSYHRRQRAQKDRYPIGHACGAAAEDFAPTLRAFPLVAPLPGCFNSLMLNNLLLTCVRCLGTAALIGLLADTARTAESYTENPGAEGNGKFTVGPEYKIDPDLTDRGNPKGKAFEFTMRLADSKIFRGDDSTLEPQNKPVNKERKIYVYVPAAYRDGAKAPILVIHDGRGQLKLVRNALDNLTISKDPNRTLPAFIAVAVQNGGNDGKNSERGFQVTLYAAFLYSTSS